MSPERFDSLLEEEFDRMRRVLSNKAEEYADTDRLHNFKASAGMGGDTPEQALWGMARKHFISISDMVRRGEYYSPDMWDEKIGDALNYLILLKALVAERYEGLSDISNARNILPSEVVTDYDRLRAGILEDPSPVVNYTEKRN